MREVVASWGAGGHSFPEVVVSVGRWPLVPRSCRHGFLKAGQTVTVQGQNDNNTVTATSITRSK